MIRARYYILNDKTADRIAQNGYSQLPKEFVEAPAVGTFVSAGAFYKNGWDAKGWHKDDLDYIPITPYRIEALVWIESDCVMLFIQRPHAILTIPTKELQDITDRVHLEAQYCGREDVKPPGPHETDSRGTYWNFGKHRT